MSDYNIDARKCAGITVYNSNGPDFEVLVYGMTDKDFLVPTALRPVEHAAARLGMNINDLVPNIMTSRNMRRIRHDVFGRYPAPTRQDMIDNERRSYNVAPSFNLRR
jgi:hypothetical protein